MSKHRLMLASLLLLQPLTLMASESFVDQTKKVKAGLEWNREIVARKAGSIHCEISSPQPIGVTLITDSAYQSLLSGSGEALAREDLILTSDHPNGQFANDIHLPAAGSYWFILENRSRSAVTMKLNCRPAGEARASD